MALPVLAGRCFFSSRRRHTIWTGDWSSDVCSSDLRRGGTGARGPAGPQGPRRHLGGPRQLWLAKVRPTEAGAGPAHEQVRPTDREVGGMGVRTSEVWSVVTPGHRVPPRSPGRGGTRG